MATPRLKPEQARTPVQFNGTARDLFADVGGAPNRQRPHREQLTERSNWLRGQEVATRPRRLLRAQPLEENGERVQGPLTSGEQIEAYYLQKALNELQGGSYKPENYRWFPWSNPQE